MLDFKKILVPYDGSAHAKKALNQAISIAKYCEGATLYVVSINEDVSALSMNNLERAYINEQLEAAHYNPGKANLKDAEAMIPEGMEAKFISKTGEPGVLLEHIADHVGADLIIMGSRGLGALSGMLLGSVSNYMLSHAKCPVFIIK